MNVLREQPHVPICKNRFSIQSRLTLARPWATMLFCFRAKELHHVVQFTFALVLEIVTCYLGISLAFMAGCLDQYVGGGLSSWIGVWHILSHSTRTGGISSADHSGSRRLLRSRAIEHSSLTCKSMQAARCGRARSRGLSKVLQECLSLQDNPIRLAPDKRSSSLYYTGIVTASVPLADASLTSFAGVTGAATSE